MSKDIKVKVRNLTKKFGDLLVLDDISFDIYDGELLCVVGPTGCGKTTFLNSLSKIFDITSGKITIDDQEVDPKKQNIAYILQEDSTMEWLTVLENVSFGLKIKGVEKSLREKKAMEAIELVGLTDFKDYYPHQLSSSMIQRISVARAFSTEPDLLLMDEPYGQLDTELRFMLEDELIRIWQKLKTTVIFITHNIEEAVYLGERVLVLTNKPTTVKEFVEIDLPHPRDITDQKFVDYRNRITELIRWW